MNEFKKYAQSEYLEQPAVDAETNLKSSPSRIAAMIALAAVMVISEGCARYLVCEPCNSKRIQKQIKENERKAEENHKKEFKKKKNEYILKLFKGVVEARVEFAKIFLIFLAKQPQNKNLLKDLKEMESSLVRILNNLKKEKDPDLRMKYEPLIKKIEQMLDQIKQFKQRETFEKDEAEE